MLARPLDRDVLADRWSAGTRSERPEPPQDRRSAALPDCYRLYGGGIEHLVRARRSTDRARIIVTPNLDHLRLLQIRPSLRRAYGAASIVVNDSRFLDRLFLRGRAACLPGSELAPLILDAAPAATRILVIGYTSAVMDALMSRFPDLVFQFLNPSQGYIRRRAERRRIGVDAAAFRPDKIFICTGAPQSELLAFQLKRTLNHACDILCCGSALLFYAGVKSRAPAWLRSRGGEWFWRFVTEPQTRTRYLKDALFLSRAGWNLAALRSGESAKVSRSTILVPKPDC